MKELDFILGHEAMFEFYEGVPSVLCPDNAKTTDLSSKGQGHVGRDCETRSTIVSLEGQGQIVYITLRAREEALEIFAGGALRVSDRT